MFDCSESGGVDPGLSPDCYATERNFVRFLDLRTGINGPGILDESSCGYRDFRVLLLGIKRGLLETLLM